MKDLIHAMKRSAEPHPQPQPQLTWKRNYTDTLTSQKPHLSDRNFPFTQLRWHWPRDQEKWPNSTGKPSAHLKHQGKSQSWQVCRTSRSVCGGEHILKPRRPPEVRDSLGEMWSERSCSSCGFSFSRFCQYWGPPEARHGHHQLGPFQLLTTFILHDQITDWPLCWLSISLRSKRYDCEIKPVSFLLDSRVLDEYYVYQKTINLHRNQFATVFYNAYNLECFLIRTTRTIFRNISACDFSLVLPQNPFSLTTYSSHHPSDHLLSGPSTSWRYDKAPCHTPVWHTYHNKKILNRIYSMVSFS